MQVAIIDNSNNRVLVCSFAEAARRVGVSTKTISRWSIDRKIERYNNYTIYFDTNIIKQPKRNNCLAIRRKPRQNNANLI